MATKNHSSSIACIAKAMVDGVATTKNFMLSVVRDEDDSEMLERALRRATAALSMGLEVAPTLVNLHVSFV